MEKKYRLNCLAASELVGTLILSALIVLVIGIVGVSLLSQGPPAEVPALRVDIHNESGNLTLIHRGGDTLFLEKTRIFVDGVDRTNDFPDPEGGAWTEFHTGDWLILPVDLMPYRDDISVQIVHTGPEVPALLFTIGDIGVPPGPWPDPTPTVTPTPTPTPFPDTITADFSGTPLSGEIPLTVQFTDLSTGSPTSWSWSFGDGGTSTAQNPTHTYVTSGTYTVSLTATNANGSDTVTKTGYITVNPVWIEIEFTSAGLNTWQAPAGVTEITVSAIAGGGGGGGRSYWGWGGAGGGGGGAFASANISIVPGNTYNLVVGAAGSGGAAGNNDGDTGGDSYFDDGSVILAKGGLGGDGGAGGAGGTGGSAASSVGDITRSGGDGAAGISTRSHYSGGGGGGAGTDQAGGDAAGTTGGTGGNEFGGNGADGLTNDGVGLNGDEYGGGGSGAREIFFGTYAGGNGASGIVIIGYWL